MRWAEIGVETTAEAQDAVANLMMENGCGGAAITGEAPVLLRCYLPVDDRLEDRLLRIQSGAKNLAGFGLDAGPAEVTVKYAEDQDWAEAWRQFFHITKVGSRIVVKPPWEEYAPEGKEIVVEIDPGMAFGTGGHPTTRLCLEALEKYLRPRMVVVDFGAGSGILAIAAAKLGASLVIAFDADEPAVKSARANVQKNNLEERIEVHQADNPSFMNCRVDLVTANLVAETVMAHAEGLAAVLKTGGVLIASGITSDRRLEIEQSLRNAGFDMAEVLAEGEWIALVARRAG